MINVVMWLDVCNSLSDTYQEHEQGKASQDQKGQGKNAINVLALGKALRSLVFSLLLEEAHIF